MKAAQKRIGITELSRNVRKVLKQHGGKNIEHRFVLPVASDALLSKLNLPKEKLKKAKQIEANSLRLQEAMTKIGFENPITTRSARVIIENALKQIPDYIERNQGNLTNSQRLQLTQLKENLKKDLPKLPKDDIHSNAPTFLSFDFLETARRVNFDTLKNILGEEKFLHYTKAMSKVNRIMAKRG